MYFFLHFPYFGGRDKIFFLASQQHIESTPNLVQEARNDVGTCLYSYLILMHIILCMAGNFIDKIEKNRQKTWLFFSENDSIHYLITNLGTFHCCGYVYLISRNILAPFKVYQRLKCKPQTTFCEKGGLRLISAYPLYQIEKKIVRTLFLRGNVLIGSV